MRSLPLGIIKNLEDVKKYATINAKITHDTPKGIDSSVAIAMLSHHLFYDKKMPEINKITPHLKDLETINYLQKLESSNYDLEQLLGKENLNIGIPCDGMRTTGAVFYLLNKYDTGVDILREAINLGGDTDSVASISLGAYLINNEMDLPSNLTKNLTNHEFGCEFLLDTADKLNQKYIL